MVGDKKFDRHGLENAQLIGTPASDADQKNPLLLCVRHTYYKLDSDYAEPLILDMSVSAIVAGVSAMAIPAACSASIFPAAVPFPPEMIAPA